MERRPAVTPETFPQAGDVVPQPDPTRLSTLQVQREISALREVLDARIQALEARTNRQQLELDAIPRVIEASRAPLILLMETKYDHLLQQFAARDQRRAEMRTVDQAALETALSAARELVTAHNRAAAEAIQKSEVQIDKRMDQLMQMLEKTSGGLRDMLDDLKARVAAIEGKTSGLNAAQTTQQTDKSLFIAIASVAIGFLGFLVSAIVAAAVLLRQS